jgi:hypothetical protein
MPKLRRYGVYWHECVLCGRTYPEGQINKNSDGEWVCKYDWGADGK